MQNKQIPPIVRLYSLLYLIVVLVLAAAPGRADTPPPQVPLPGMVTMVDLGAKKCIPCKMMAPILLELEKDYKNRAAIVFIDVWENRQAAGQFGIDVIPTQIFYNAEGKEMLRHKGFMDRDAIVAELTRLGVK